MAHLTINAVNYDVKVDGSQNPEPARGGGYSRAFGGGLRSALRWKKPIYERTLAPLLAGPLAVLKAVDGTIVPIAGDSVAAVNALVLIVAERHIPDGQTGGFQTEVAVRLETV